MIPIRRPWARKPASPLPVSGPHARGLVAAIVPGVGGGARKIYNARGVNLDGDATAILVPSARDGQGLDTGYATTGYQTQDYNLNIGQPFTLLAVVTVPAGESNDQNETLVALETTASNRYASLIYRDNVSTESSRYPIFRIRLTGASNIDLSSSETSFPAGTRLVVAGVMHSTADRRIYVNGIERGQSTTSHAGSFETAEVSIGDARRNGSGGSSGNPFDGQNYLSLVWNRALSPGEIAAISGNPWQIFSRTTYIPTAAAAATTTGLIPIRRRRRFNSLSYDGAVTKDLALASAIPAAYPFSIASWVTQRDKDETVIASINRGNSQSVRLELAVSFAENFRVNVANGSNVWWDPGVPRILDKWHGVVWTATSTSNHTLTVNGQDEVGTGLSMNTPGTGLNTATTGGAYIGAGDLSGNVALFAYWDRVLTAPERIAISNFVDPTIAAPRGLRILGRPIGLNVVEARHTASPTGRVWGTNHSGSVTVRPAPPAAQYPLEIIYIPTGAAAVPPADYWPVWRYMYENNLLLRL